MPSFRQTPIDETSGQALFTMALPTLFPLGKADFSIPRLRTVSLSDWAQHLMRYKDGRFGSHPRFRYMVFNQIIRQRIASSSRWVANKNNGHSLTVNDLRQILEPDSEDYNPLLNNIFRQGNVIAGARPFWSTKRHELQAYCRNLGCRALYYTFSAADMQWDDLQRQMPRIRRVPCRKPDDKVADCSGQPPEPPSYCGWVALSSVATFFKARL